MLYHCKAVFAIPIAGRVFKCAIKPLDLCWAKKPFNESQHPRDKDGKFTDGGGGSGGTSGESAADKPETPEGRRQAAKGSSAARECLRRAADVRDAMKSSDGHSIDFEYGNQSYGLSHISQRAAQRQEKFKDGMTAEKITAGVANAIAHGAPKEGKVKGKVVYEHNGFVGVLKRKGKRYVLLTGYDKNENKR